MGPIQKQWIEYFDAHYDDVYMTMEFKTSMAWKWKKLGYKSGDIYKLSLLGMFLYVLDLNEACPTGFYKWKGKFLCSKRSNELRYPFCNQHSIDPSIFSGDIKSYDANLRFSFLTFRRVSDGFENLYQLDNNYSRCEFNSIYRDQSKDKLISAMTDYKNIFTKAF